MLIFGGRWGWAIISDAAKQFMMGDVTDICVLDPDRAWLCTSAGSVLRYQWRADGSTDNSAKQNLTSRHYEDILRMGGVSHGACGMQSA